MRDRWIWSLEASEDFSVTSARRLIDDYLLPKGNVQTRWVKVVPFKINVFALRVCLDKLPTRLNLSLRGVEISSIMCPICNSSVESASLLFFTCHVARLIWKKFLRWWDLDENMIDSYDDSLLLLKNIRLPKRLKDLFEGVCYVKWWLIWRIRNQVLFSDKHPPRDTLFDGLITISFQSYSNRYNSKLNRFVLKKPSHATRGVQVGSKVGFKLTKEYMPVAKKPTANTSVNKNKGVEPTKERAASSTHKSLSDPRTWSATELPSRHLTVLPSYAPTSKNSSSSIDTAAAGVAARERMVIGTSERTLGTTP
nr:RNA-directed DNA polymerase, eukaryota [Tanacetum cinerariifolium]